MPQVNDCQAEAGRDAIGAASLALYDPTSPIVLPRHGTHLPTALSRLNQRLRRAHILATIRQLLTEGGFDNVTMRKISNVSGHAVQTIYNLVGPRDHAIVEAIAEYTRFVGRTAQPVPEDRNAVAEIVDRWFQSIVANPEFCRQVSLISFTESREIFYKFRDGQYKGMRNLLIHQQKCGVIRRDVDARELSELIVLLASAVCTEWADRPCSLDKLQRRLYSGVSELLSRAVVTRGAGAHIGMRTMLS